MDLILKSQTSDILLSDVGVIIRTGSGSSFNDPDANASIRKALGGSTALRALVTAGTVVVNDGTQDLGILAGLQYLNKQWFQSGSDIAVAMGQVEGVVSDVQHGDKTSGSLHAVATQSVNGFMSSADKTKFDGAKAIYQTLQTIVVTDISTNSVYPVYAATPVARVAITKRAGTILRVSSHVSAELTNANATVFFGVDIGGAWYSRYGFRAPAGGSPSTGSSERIVAGLAAGAYNVDLVWAVSNATAWIYAATKPESERAALIVQELDA